MAKQSMAFGFIKFDKINQNRYNRCMMQNNPQNMMPPQGVPQMPQMPQSVPQNSPNNKFNSKLSIIGFSLAILFGLILAFVGYKYFDLKSNFDKKLEQEKSIAVLKRSQALNQEFIEREKQPFTQFVAPEDLGRLAFSYPKTWSVYIAQNSASSYKAYLNPKKIRPINSSSRYALRLEIKNRSYEVVKHQFDSLVKSGKLKLEVVKINGQNSILLRGKFNQYIEGSAVVFKLRDKTVILSTDAKQFETDFAKIVDSISYNL